jgi:hypothetical protein
VRQTREEGETGVEEHGRQGSVHGGALAGKGKPWGS